MLAACRVRSASDWFYCVFARLVLSRKNSPSALLLVFGVVAAAVVVAAAAAPAAAAAVSVAAAYFSAYAFCFNQLESVDVRSHSSKQNQNELTFQTWLTTQTRFIL